MIKIQIASDDIGQLKKLKNHIHPLVQTKALALLLKHQSMRHNKITSTLDICSNTLRNYLRGYQAHGMKFVTSVNAYRPQSDLQSFDEAIMKYLDESPPASISYIDYQYSAN